MFAEHANELSAYGINYIEALDRFDGDEAFFERLMTRFAEENSCAALHLALFTDDAGSVYRAAHALKGVAGTLCCSELYACASRVADSARAGDLATSAAGLNDLDQAYDRVLKAIRRFAG